MSELEKRNKENKVVEEIGRASLENDQLLREQFDRLASLLIKSISPDQPDEALNELQRKNENSV